MVVGVVEARQQWVPPRWCVKASSERTTRSAAPRPVGESVSGANERTNIIEQGLVDLEHARRASIVEGDRRRKGVSELLDRHRPARQRAQRRGCGGRLPIDEHLGEQMLIVFQQNRPMLQKSTSIPHLRATHELPSIRDQLTRDRYVEAGRDAWSRRPSRCLRLFRIDPQRAERLQEQTIDRAIRFRERSVERDGGGDGVRDLVMMQDRAPAGEAPDEIDSPGSGDVEIVAAAGRLVTPQGDRRPRPGVYPEHRLARTTGSTQQRFVEGHVRSAVCGWGHEQPGCVLQPRPVLPGRPRESRRGFH